MLLQLKAIFLILIFGANTLIGFCCSMGMNMSFSPFSNQHFNSVKNIHHKTISKDSKKHKVFSNKKNALNEGNCCNGRVVKLAQTDKSLAVCPVIVNPVFFTSYLSSYFNCNSLLLIQINTTDSYFLKNYHPPITDIRIAIRSFQI